MLVVSDVEAIEEQINIKLPRIFQLIYLLHHNVSVYE
jgi:hypothetical protein